MSVRGQILWHDLTVEDAESVRDFYARVIGLETGSVSMGEYEDYTLGVGENTVAGVCHARGANAAVPPQWLVYFSVDDLDESLRICREEGGKVLVEPRKAGDGTFAVIEDPAGAVCALYMA